ncbi:MAG: hypothetical protein ACRERC_06785 [Candidatus Binatia bacterium]
MRINHRIAARHDDPFWGGIDRLGIDYDRGNPDNVLRLAVSVLNVTEDHPQWPHVERLVAEHRLGPHLIENHFTKGEVDAAEWLSMSALGHHGYPQPEDDFGFINATYDVSNLCHLCGIGGVQKAPFRLRAEPKASRSQFLQLNWVFDEFFVRSGARQGLAAAGLTGFDLQPALLHSKNTPSAEVEQLSILSLLPPALDSAELQIVTCKERNEEWESSLLQTSAPNRTEVPPYCGRVKHHLEHRGPLRFSRGAFVGAPDVVRSTEWFGSGANAFHLVLVSGRFRKVVSAAKWRGLSFEPLELAK